MSLSLLIFGSCVSRDILNFDSEGAVDLVAYFARSSIASAFCGLAVRDDYSHRLSSPFQKRIVNADLTKVFISELERLKFDLLLVDMIDERFDLLLFDDGGVCTLSNEFLQAVSPDSVPGVRVRSGSQQFYELWEAGWRKFVVALKKSGKLGRLRINKVFWSTTTSAGKGFDTYGRDYILESNRFLDRLYTRIAKDLEPWQFIEANPDHLLAADEHRWGVSPFHYIDAYYNHALRKILTTLDWKTVEHPTQGGR